MAFIGVIGEGLGVAASIGDVVMDRLGIATVLGGVKEGLDVAFSESSVGVGLGVVALVCTRLLVDSPACYEGSKVL